MFNVDFRQIFYNVLPFFLRSPISLAWVYSWAKPLKDLNIIFSAFRDNTIYKLQFTSQTIYLEHYLNDQFDQIGRGIYIVTNDVVTITFLGLSFEVQFKINEYNNIEGQPSPFVYNTSEQIDAPNFSVYIPNTLVFNINELNEKINFYNQAGKSFEIIYY